MKLEKDFEVIRENFLRNYDKLKKSAEADRQRHESLTKEGTFR